MPPEVLRRLLLAAGDDLVLIGGQALAFWMGYYSVSLAEHLPAVSRDADFLALSADDREAVYRMAGALAGKELIPEAHELTALVGQAIRKVDAESYLNVDIVFQVYGNTAERVRAFALQVEHEDAVFRVMHPMHVLQSRLDNLYGLSEKRNRVGELQLMAAIGVARRAQTDLAERTKAEGATQRSPTLAFVKFIAALARRDAGRKVASRHGLHVADAIEPGLVTEATFVEHQLPRLRAMMSAERRAELDAESVPVPRP